MRNILIAGIGNVLLGDDGVGPYVARLLSARYDFEEGIEVADLGTPALDLIDEIAGREAVILIDSVNTKAAAGTVQLYRKDDIVRHRPAARMDPHSPALVETLLAAELFGVAPANVILVGISGASFGASCELSPAVQISVPLAIAEVLREVGQLGVSYQPKQRAEADGIWWTSAPHAECSCSAG
jgi:hydrogenase maturation protease